MRVNRERKKDDRGDIKERKRKWELVEREMERKAEWVDIKRES